jgi:hypothetical protein
MVLLWHCPVEGLMIKRRIFVSVLACWLSGGTLVRAAEVDANTLQNYAKLQLSFERYGDTEYVARGQGYSIDLRGGTRLVLRRTSTISMDFVHGRRSLVVEANLLPGKVNYIRGRDPRQWKLGIPTYGRVTYHGVYPGVDVVYYGNQDQLEFDVVLQPGADLAAVRMRFKGVEKAWIDDEGGLVLEDLRLRPPVVTQGKKSIAARYAMLAGGDVGFKVAEYDRSRPLLIDPTIVYSTLLGGGTGDTQGAAIALDSSGNAYIAGYTGALDFPAVNAASAGLAGLYDGFISKINSTGTALIYSTYIGGSGYDYLQGVAVDSTGAAWVVGYTQSNDFPVINPVQNNLSGLQDAVVVKLNPSGGLAFSTYLGGSGTSANSVAVDSSGNAYVTGNTTSIQTTPGAFQSLNQGGSDAFVAKLSSTGVLDYSTYLGGSGEENGRSIAIDSSGNAYITGETSSLSFPGAPGGGAQPANAGNGDGFVAKLNAVGSAVLYFTFIGGSASDVPYAIAVDTGGNAYIAGDTASANFPVTAGAAQSQNAGGPDGFVAKLNSTGSAFSYVTYLGGERQDSIRGLAYESSSGGVYVAGYTDSAKLPAVSAVQNSLLLNSVALFETTNSGGLWSAFDSSIPGTTQDLTADPVTPGVFVVSTESAIQRTIDNGATWTPQSSFGSAALSRSLANSNYIYATYLGTTYLSTDGGVTWTNKGYAGNYWGGIVPDPFTATTAYGYSVSAGVFATTNGGTTWGAANSGLPSTNVRDMVAASDGSLYVAIYPYGIYKSTNQGASWSPVNTGLPIPAYFTGPFNSGHVLIASPSIASTLYFADGNVYKTTNRGGNWASSGGFVPNGAQGLAVSPQNSSVLYASSPTYPVSTFSLIYLSIDGGNTWNLASTGLGGASIQGLLVDPFNSARAFAFATVPYNGFVAKLNSTGTAFTYSTYFGGSYGSSSTLIYGIATNGTGDAFVTGQGSSLDLPVTSGMLPTTGNGINGALVARISDATAACSYTVSPASSLVGTSAQTLTYKIIAPSGCTWTAMSNQSWATILAGASGSGTGLLFVAITANATGMERSAILSAGGTSATVTQSSTSCSYSQGAYNPIVPAAGGTLQLSVTAGAGCDWTYVNNNPFVITVLSGGSGTGNGTVSLSIAANYSRALRYLSLQSAQTGLIQLTQPGTSLTTHFSVTPTSFAVTAGLPIQLTVTALKGDNTTDATYSDNVHFMSTDTSAVLPYDRWLSNGVGTFTAEFATIGAQTLTASDALSPTITGTSANIAVSPASGLRFVPVTPCRVADTRNPAGPFGAPFIAARTSRSFTIPNSACGIPSTAQAYSLNVTVVPHGSLSYLTVWPTGQTQPLASTLNSLDGRIKANAAVVPAGSGGAISVFATDDTDLILDINGYFVPATNASALAFYPMTPCRLVDTRINLLSSGALSADVSRTLPLQTSSCNVPATAQAYSLNFTVVPPGTLGYLSVWPTGEGQPLVSTLNDLTGTIVANAAMVPAGTSGSIDVYATNTTDLVVDINGYFAPPTAGGLSFYNLPPCRVLDTRSPSAPPFVDSLVLDVIHSGCGGTSAVQGYVLNATVVPAGPLGYLTLWPQGAAQPTVSTLNALDGAITSNMAIVPTSNTNLSAYASGPSTTHLILDMFGYFAP